MLIIINETMCDLNSNEKEYLEEFRLCIDDDGTISPKEQRLLDRLRDKLGISEERARELENNLYPQLSDEEQEYLKEFKECFEDEKQISSGERRLLNKIREKLKISDSRVAEIERLVTNNVNKASSSIEDINNPSFDDYLKLAEQGDSKAQFNLGNCYCNGQGVQQDYQLAVQWYMKAAEQGDSDAQFNLGFCYENGYGVQPNGEQAKYWYELAANQGQQDAINRLEQVDNSNDNGNG